MEGLGEMKPEMMFGSPWHEEYVRIAPHPDRFDALFAKKSAMDKTIKDLAPETLQAITAPTLTWSGTPTSSAPSTPWPCSASSAAAWWGPGGHPPGAAGRAPGDEPHRGGGARRLADLDGARLPRRAPAPAPAPAPAGGRRERRAGAQPPASGSGA